MGGEGFSPTPEDQVFLNLFGRETEQLLHQSDLDYDFYMNIMRQHNDANMLKNIRAALASGNNEPVFERAMKDFLSEIGEAEE
jgi:hypothetical protein